MKSVSHQQASKLLHNKFIVVLGDSIQRSVYKDLVLLLQKDKYLTSGQLRSKGEISFEQDCLVEGGCLGPLHNGTEYREVRQFQSDHHLVRFYFVTRVYSRYMKSILEDFRHGLKPDVIIINSCVWDISRYLSTWEDNYQENLKKFFVELKEILPEETLIVWNLTMPLGERIKGGFLVPEIEHKSPQLRYDVIEANFYSGKLADAYGLDVLDLHFQFRFSLQHRTKDGVHWNALAHRRITSLLIHHSAQAWGVIMTRPLPTFEHTEVTEQQPSRGYLTRSAGSRRAENASYYHYHYPPLTNYFSNMEHQPSKIDYNGYREEYYSDALPCSYLNFENSRPNHHKPPGACRPVLTPLPPPPAHRHPNTYRNLTGGFMCMPPHHLENSHGNHHDYVMRNRLNRPNYAPYTRHRPSQHARHGRYY